MGIAHYRHGNIIRWMHGGSAALNEPFFSSAIEKLRAQDPPPSEFETEIGELIEAACNLPPVQPAGIIFPMSRCGSTLMLNALKAADEVVGLGEAQPVTRVLQMASAPSDHWRALGKSLLMSLMSIYASCEEAGDKERLCSNALQMALSPTPKLSGRVCNTSPISDP